MRPMRRLRRLDPPRSLHDPGCEWPECKCEVSDYALSKHNRRQVCSKIKDPKEEDPAPPDKHHGAPKRPRRRRAIWPVLAISNVADGQTRRRPTRIIAPAIREVIIAVGGWLTATQIAEIVGSARLDKWKKDGQIFAVNHRCVEYFPDYVLGPSTDYRPAKGLARVQAIFRGQKDDWSIVSWFLSANSFLGGERPQDLLIRNPDRVAAAAADEVGGVVDG